MPRSQSERPRIGLIGVIGYARIYLDYLLPAHDAGKVELVATVVIPPHQELPIVSDLRQRGVLIFSSFEEMLGSALNLDLHFIPTGIHWHARMAIASLKADVNVLVEKPLAGSTADAEQVLRTERETGRWVAVGFQDIYAKETSLLKEELISGAIGRIRSVSMIGLWPRPVSYYTRNNWAGRLTIDGAAAMDSPLNNAFAHFINLALFLAGATEEASSVAEVTSAELYRAHEIESFDTAVVKAESDSGVRFWFGVSHACRELREPEIRIEGEEGSVEWRHEQSCTIRRSNGEIRRMALPNSMQVRQRMFDNVVGRLSDPSVTICNTRIALAHTKLIQAVHEHEPILRAPAKLIEMHKDPESDVEQYSIKGVEAAISRAFETSSTLAEIGFPEVGG